MKRRIALLIAAVYLAALIVACAWAKNVVDHAQPHRLSACPSAAEAATYYREWTWHWEDQLQEPRTTAGYRPGKPVRSCRAMRQHVTNWRVRAVKRRKLVERLNSNIPLAIRTYWGAEAEGAIVVARCETGSDLTDIAYALTIQDPGSQYLGIFQMGTWERTTWARWRGAYRYSTVIEQVRAARRMWEDRGSTWGPWACRPDGTVAY